LYPLWQRALGQLSSAARHLRDDQVAAVISFLEALSRFAKNALRYDQRDRIAIVEMLLNLVALEQHIQRHHRSAGLENGVVAHHEVRPVWEHDRHFLAWPDPRCTSPLAILLAAPFNSA